MGSGDVQSFGGVCGSIRPRVSAHFGRIRALSRGASFLITVAMAAHAARLVAKKSASRRLAR